MSESDIENAIRDAEKYADEDKKRKEAVEVKNSADTMIYQTKKTLDDLGDKIDSADRNAIEDEKAALEDSMSSDDIELIKSNTEALQKCLYDMTEKMYNSVKGDADNGQNDYYGEPDGDFVDADFTEVD
jgi:molecular chaperone DnaK